MKYKEMIDAMLNGKKITTSRCVECGQESTFWFGFGTGCRYNGGSHQKFEEIETTLDHERNKVKSHYSCCMWYDREKFDKYVPQEIKNLIWNNQITKSHEGKKNELFNY